MRDPELAAELTCQPVRRYGVDAAILFSDIMVPYAAIGCGVGIVAGTGPVVEPPFRTDADLGRLRPFDPATDTPFVLEAVLRAVDGLDVPVIGFAGAPFTVASYLVEGGPSRDLADEGVDALRDGNLVPARRSARRDRARLATQPGRGRGGRGATL